MPVPLLDLERQYASIKNELDRAVAGVVRSQRFIMGPPVDELEQQLSERLRIKHAIGCASGTDAILLGLKALDLRPDSEVVVPTFTFFATAGAVWNAGLKPVFADVEATTFNLTADTIRAALTPRTKAVVVVHLYGQMAEMLPIMQLCEERGIALIEDAAQSIGARQLVDGVERESGTLGVAGTFSFFPSKNLGAFGDGGLITTNDDRLAEKLRKLRVHGGRQMYEHEMVGTNSRLDALQAAVLSAKLPYLERWTDARRSNAAKYDAAFAGSEHVTTPAALAHNHHVYNQYTIRAARRDALKQQLDQARIGSAVYYPVPLHLQECFRPLGYKRGDFPVSERAVQEVLSIPIYPELSSSEQDEVVNTILGFYKDGE
jgi:dTDP-4-amino-4,6-dideoxygalactose transaminase